MGSWVFGKKLIGACGSGTGACGSGFQRFFKTMSSGEEAPVVSDFEKGIDNDGGAVKIEIGEMGCSRDEAKRVWFYLKTNLHQVESGKRLVGDFKQTFTGISDFLKIFHRPLIDRKVSNRYPTPIRRDDWVNKGVFRIPTLESYGVVTINLPVCNGAEGVILMSLTNSKDGSIRLDGV